MKKVGILGSGVVGQVLADGLLTHGYEVMRGSREPKKLAEWKEKAGPKAGIGTFAEAARFGEVVILAVKGSAAEEALGQVREAVAGKTVMDATNPIAEAPPEKGVLQLFTGPNESLMERLQRLVPSARLVKAFSCTGNANMIDPVFPGGKPTMFICGDEPAAKEQVRAMLDRLGWETADMGPVEAARAIEPLCVLWCIPGFREGSWTHAFKLLRR